MCSQVHDHLHVGLETTKWGPVFSVGNQINEQNVFPGEFYIKLTLLLVSSFCRQGWGICLSLEPIFTRNLLTPEHSWKRGTCPNALSGYLSKSPHHSYTTARVPYLEVNLPLLQPPTAERSPPLIISQRFWRTRILSSAFREDRTDNNFCKMVVNLQYLILVNHIIHRQLISSNRPPSYWHTQKLAAQGRTKAETTFPILCSPDTAGWCNWTTSGLEKKSMALFPRWHGLLQTSFCMSIEKQPPPNPSDASCWHLKIPVIQSIDLNFHRRSFWVSRPRNTAKVKSRIDKSLRAIANWG